MPVPAPAPAPSAGSSNSSNPVASEDGNNATAAGSDDTVSVESATDDNTSAETPGTAPEGNITSTSGGYSGEKESLGEHATVCKLNSVPVDTLKEGITINPGCVLLSDQVTCIYVVESTFSFHFPSSANCHPQTFFFPKCIQDLSVIPPVLPTNVTTVELVTVCMRREAGPVLLDTAKLTSLGMVVGTASRIASLGNGDDTQATVFKVDKAEGSEFKRYLGTPAKDNEYTKISSLVANKYDNISLMRI